LNESLINLLKFKNILISLNVEEENILKRIQPSNNSKHVLQLIKSQTFWNNCKNLQNTIGFPALAIKALESNKAMLADAYYYFIKILKHFRKDSFMERRTLQRFELANLDFMGIAYFLTPKFTSAKFLAGHKDKIIEIIIDLAS